MHNTIDTKVFGIDTQYGIDSNRGIDSIAQLYCNLSFEITSNFELLRLVLYDWLSVWMLQGAEL